MILEHYAWYHHALGGALIGVAALVLMYSIGQIAGISGVLSGTIEGCLKRHPNWAWQIAFFAGLMAPGFFMLSSVGAISPPISNNPTLLVVAGLLVGLGARIANGCTSGHGICGIGRLSMRSIIATATFMASAVITVALM